MRRAAALLSLLGAACQPPPSTIRATDAGAGDVAPIDDGAADAAADGAARRRAVDVEPLQRAFVDLRFGMFLHFGILTYTGVWAEPNLDITLFNPTALDPGQWADAALAAGMKFGVLTTRHHDGFALWDSAAGTFDTGSIPWRGGQGDVVREYVDAFRSRGLGPGLYYSVWDTTHPVGTGPLTPDQLAYVETQLTELLTNYGPIPLLIFDGWSWKMGHRRVPYDEIRELVKSLQPNCLMLDNTHLMSPWENDLVGVEEAQGNAFIPADNTYPAVQMQKINAAGGNDWFWASNIGGLMTAEAIVTGHLGVLEPRWTNFLLNCPPNRDGLLDAAMVSRLAEVGATWAPNLARPPLPAQGPQIEYAYDPVAASASAVITAPDGGAPQNPPQNAIDGVNNGSTYTIWQSTTDLPQAITVDLGQVRPDVDILDYLPRNIATVGPSADGAITSYVVSVSTDGTLFNEVANGTWDANGKMKVAVFDPIPARFVRLQARAVNGAAAVATEISVGARGR